MRLRFLISFLLSALLHLAVLFIFVSTISPSIAHFTPAPQLNVHLAARRPGLIRPAHQASISRTASADQKLPVPEPASTSAAIPSKKLVLQESNTEEAEKVSGIAIPASIPLPYSVNKSADPALLSEEHIVTEAAPQPPPTALGMQIDQRQNPDQQIRLMRLKAVLNKIAENHPGITGHCIHVFTPGGPDQQLHCDNPALAEAIKPYQQLIDELLKPAQETSPQQRELFFTNVRNNMIIIN